MLYDKVAEKRGFRSLTASEVETVSGGFEITVSATRPGNPGFGDAGGGGIGGNGNETGNNPDPSLAPNVPGADAGTFELPIEVSLDPNEGTADVSVEVEEGIAVDGTIRLDGFDLEKLSLSFLNKGNELKFDLQISSLQFGVDTFFDLGNGITLQAKLQLDDDGTFSNGSVIFRVEF